MTGRPRPRPGLDLVEGYHSPQVEVAVRLNTNESPEPPPAAFMDRLAQVVRDIAPHRYPDREATELRRAIGALHGVGPGNVLVANGSNEVLQSVCLAHGGPGRTAVVFEPTYAMHSHIAAVCGTVVEARQRGADHRIDLDVARAVIDDTDPDIVFVCSPNNPTGTVEPPETVRVIAEAARGVVVVDEAYGQFAPWSALELVDEDAAVAVTRTFSKTWALAGLRLGYLVGPTWLVEQLHKVVLPYHLDAYKQAAGLVALEFGDQMDQRVARITEERGRLAQRLGELEVDVTPSGSNFILFRPRTGDADAVWQGLVERSVLVRNCASWPGLEGCLRVTIGTRADDDTFLEALAEVLAES